jgi:hypothetical protein
MYNAIKNLAMTQLHATASAVYTGPTAGKSTEVKMVWLHNTAGSTLQVRLYLQENTTSSLFYNESIASNESREVSPSIPFIISGTGSLFAVAANSGSVNAFVEGREES